MHDVEERISGIDSRFVYSASDKANRKLINSHLELLKYCQQMEKCWNEAFTAASVMGSRTFAVNASDFGFYLGVLSNLASSLPFASTIFSAATQVAYSLKEAADCRVQEHQYADTERQSYRCKSFFISLGDTIHGLSSEKYSDIDTESLEEDTDSEKIIKNNKVKKTISLSL